MDKRLAETVFFVFYHKQIQYLLFFLDLMVNVGWFHDGLKSHAPSSRKPSPTPRSGQSPPLGFLHSSSDHSELSKPGDGSISSTGLGASWRQCLSHCCVPSKAGMGPDT